MSLEELKSLIEEKFEVRKHNDIEIKLKNGRKRLRYQFVLNCYYDENNHNYYGYMYHWWLNSSKRTPFVIDKSQVMWLIKKLARMNNCLNYREGEV